MSSKSADEYSRSETFMGVSSRTSERRRSRWDLRSIIVMTAVLCVRMDSIIRVVALDNGLARTPQMGFSSWNADGSTVNASGMAATAAYFVHSGLQKLGYEYMNVDEGWMIGRRHDTLEPVADPKLFPNGMKSIGDALHKAGFKFGLYTSRGSVQCSRPEYRHRCIHTPPNPPMCKGPHPTSECGCEGSHGFEENDMKWMVQQGADYMKVDSCGGSTNHASAFAEYTEFRDALNTSGSATGRPIFFSICGWNSWYAPPNASIGYAGGTSLGNSWRISGDGRDWDHLTNSINIMANLTEYTGPGGYNDPDLLIGPWCGIDHNQSFCGQTDQQARSQFSLWAVFPAPLLISQNVHSWSNYALETYSNREAIMLNQEPNGRAAVRLVGGDLRTVTECRIDTKSTNNSSCINIWGRRLHSAGEIVLVFLNNGPQTIEISCGPSCLRKLEPNFVPSPTYSVRDLWRHAQVGTTVGGSFTASVEPNGGHRLLKLRPLSAAYTKKNK